jgi:hypothetical protein
VRDICARENQERKHPEQRETRYRIAGRRVGRLGPLDDPHLDISDPRIRHGNPQLWIDQYGFGAGITTADNAYFADVYRYLGEASATTYAQLPGGKIQFTGTTDKVGFFR